MSTFKRRLQSYGACEEAVDWVGERTQHEAWAECERADWMLWLLFTRAGEPGWPTIQTAYLCACDCAETALKYVPPGEDRPRLAIAARRKWCRGEATDAEVTAARAAAWAAAGDAARDAAWAARDAAWAAAGDAAYKQMCELIRQRVPALAGGKEGVK